MSVNPKEDRSIALCIPEQRKIPSCTLPRVRSHIEKTIIISKRVLDSYMYMHVTKYYQEVMWT